MSVQILIGSLPSILPVIGFWFSVIGVEIKTQDSFFGTVFG
jgi:hypothetical protein